MRSVAQIARAIVQVWLPLRRGALGNVGLWEAKAAAAVRRGEPVHFVLPAFPAKSPNRGKTLGDLPDLAEALALETLAERLRAVRAIYAPGARLTIASDGRVFGDLVGVSDAAVAAYGAALEALIPGEDISVLRLGDVAPVADCRGWLVARWAEPMAALRQRALAEPGELALVNGLHRFLFEDGLALWPGLSRSAVRRRARPLAWEVVRRSHAWSALLADRYPEAIRLSIHPQSPGSEKLGIHLMSSGDDWLTPWHGAALEVDGELRLVKRAMAPEASVVMANGRPSYLLRSMRRAA